MTTAPERSPAQTDLVTLTIDGVEVSVPKGTLIIRAAEEIGIEIPRFCDHPGLDPVGACRQCLVEVWMPGPPGPDGTPGEARQMQGPPGRMKPQASCTMTVAPGMIVKTQLTSEAIDKAQQGVMEMLLVNHPLDCPVCDKGGECPLQNQAMSHGRATSRFEDVKRTYPKPINISSQVLLDRERCVLCARCTRFSEQVAGDPFIALVERGALQQVGIYEEKPFESYFSGNTVQICPVGALTGAAYRFRARPFDLVSTSSVCEHCASGCAQRTDHRRGQVMRRLAHYDPAVNEEWNCDKGRWAFTYPLVGDRLQFPMVRENGVLRVASWPEALAAAADGLAAATAAGIDDTGVGVLVGGRVSMEDAYAYSALSRALGGADIDFRARPHSAEEAAFLAHAVRGVTPETGGVTYADLESASSVLLVGLEPEDESPIVFLRLRKAFRKNKTGVYAVAPLPSRGLAKVGGTLLASAPGTEAQVLDGIARGSSRATESMTRAGEALREGGAVILVGERLASVPGALSAAVRLAEATGARLAWVPRRAGERGALEAGAIAGRSTAEMVRDAAVGRLGALVVGGVDPYDIVSAGAGHADGVTIDTEDVLEAMRRAFVVSLEVRESAVTELADVVLPVAPHAEKAGTFLDWEGRARPFEAALDSGAMSDYRVLDMLATELGTPIGTRTLSGTRDRLVAEPEPTRPTAPTVEAGEPAEPGAGHVLLATWHHLLDMGRMQDGEPFLAGTAPATVAKVSPGTAETFGLVDGDAVEVSTDSGSIVLPVVVTEGMVDHVVWMPTNSAGAPVRSALGVDSGAVVGLRKADLVATVLTTEDGVA
ncbi:NADH-quinone oxidoreductase subunit G [Nostocoides sp. F2B08]|uniref:NADH-quinone oxidoreductase subunit G n=1 Tax=Nostocoides sp. F2B08 TaxID=2653936 RepID=UPI001262CD6E|nr:NADH-quinone oxidoreductase subunit G [Tetrasphaera sp. F2B08]KAB7746427.1 NADH-quinone oxidoreductase subunit G [Tetrasphaera sp. F2B08]